VKDFINLLSDAKKATDQQSKEELWQVEGRLKNGNQTFKFDIRPLIPVRGTVGKTGYFKTKSDKIVFETINKWVIFDTEELHKYINPVNKRVIDIQELLENLSWNLIIDK
tara:strand:- start:227 stop:556 length:330 start_codon:yes stop_codon:yes gene_type:complete